MKLSFLFVALAFSNSAMATDYACDGAIKLSTRTDGVKMTVDFDSPVVSGKNLEVLSGGELLPGYQGLSGMYVSKIGSPTPFKGVQLVSTSIVQGGPKGQINQFTGEGYEVFNCTRQ